MKNLTMALLLSLITISSVHPAMASEFVLPDEARTHQCVAVFEGTVISAKMLRELKSGALYSAKIRVDSVEKGQAEIKESAEIFYEQTFIGQDQLTRHGRICPGYPQIKVGQKVKVWCIRQTTEDYKDALFLPTSQYVKQIK